MVCYPAGSSYQKMVHWSDRGKDVVGSTTQLGWWVSGGQSVPRKQSSHRYTTSTSSTVWIHCLHQIQSYHTRMRNLSKQATLFQTSLVQFWGVRVNWNLSFLFLAGRSGTSCGLPPPFQGSRRCAVSSAHFGCTCVIFSYCQLLVCSKHSGQLQLTGYFSSICKPYRLVVWEDPNGSAVSEILRPTYLVPKSRSGWKPLKSPFFTTLMLDLNFSRWLARPCYNALSCCCLIDGLDVYVNVQQNKFM